MTPNTKPQSGGSSTIMPDRYDELVPIGKVDGLYIAYTDEGAEFASVVEGASSITVVTPSPIYPCVQRSDIQIQPLETTPKCDRFLARAFDLGLARLQTAVCEIAENINKHVVGIDGEEEHYDLPAFFFVNFTFNPEGETHLVKTVRQYEHRTACGLTPNSHTCADNLASEVSREDVCRNCRRSRLFSALGLHRRSGNLADYLLSIN